MNAQLLIENGADVELKDSIGITPLDFSAIFGKFAVANNWTKISHSFWRCADAANIAKLLIANEANVSAVNEQGNSPLDFAVSFGEYK